ncbi:class I SAM-dependent methyltransferase [Cohnella terricola]|uniref:class I SAM-dependent methyltransferase n=1 Tax=Cohnella terricola TaxID=1289167 RepID=UPI00319D8EE4
MNPSIEEHGLDIGTGTGNLAGRFIEKGCSMSGVDQSREMLRLARTKYPGLAARLGNFLALPYLRERFDFIVTSFAFHHLTEDQQWLALEEMQRLLAPRGKICIADLMDASAVGKPREHPEYPSAPMLTRWFEASGYAVKTHRVNHLLHIIHARKEER